MSENGRSGPSAAESAPTSVGPADGHAPHHLVGSATLRRVNLVRFPVFELNQDGKVLASLGRYGWIKIFFGRGQRVDLADGSRWRIKSVGIAGMICPAIFDSSKRKVAISSFGVGTYGINGKDYGCVFYQADKPRFGRANRWILRRNDIELAEVTRYPASFDAAEPVHLGAVLMAFTLVRYGILGESAPRFSFRW